jgi:hypothetical protein
MKVKGQARRDQEVGCDHKSETDILDGLNGVEKTDSLDSGSVCGPFIQRCLGIKKRLTGERRR